MNESILIVEDEAKIARLLEIELECEGYRTEKTGDGLEAWERYQAGGLDLILLDVMLPGISGFELLRRIRSKDAYIPIILLTAKDSVEDKVVGLDRGANDYMSKPFQIEELLARVRAALRLRRAAEHVAPPQDSSPQADMLTVADLTVNELTREVVRDGKRIELTPREYDLLVYLMRNTRQALHRDQILQAVWGFDYYGDTNVVDVYIRYIRKKIDSGSAAPLIHTVRGVGYTLKETL